jgi:hypothetical protein
MQQPNKINQRGRLLAFLKARANEWIPLAQVMAVAGPQYGARVHELRGLGHRIENFQHGERSWFRLVSKTLEAMPSKDKCEGETDRLFADDGAPHHLDLG